ncbi:TOMM propeptide domain protein [Desulfosporosinus orientis DSM 765]|uniref:TOMM propeptide domain protein n=1 Tax=Desulfosporosinus orientis (strain ATCC 19365 / DSM 765 / NCIMB 8382 / VKM B-1628 / Singapore I) TaxID=768706 RepID=G7W6U7_DESOD|nr:NHLP leader peptide family RiPP precursor [Desulfosporosinus orientis]AET69229.1 TOMM propeptide domain protein [Desulfosporosinus orientis DSM 765]
MSEEKLPSWQEFQNELVVRALKDESFRKELLADPKAVVEKEMGKLKEGSKLPEALEVKVIEQPANALYLVLPTISDELSDEALENVAGGQGNEVYDFCCLYACERGCCWD